MDHLNITRFLNPQLCGNFLVVIGGEPQGVESRLIVEGLFPIERHHHFTLTQPLSIAQVGTAKIGVWIVGII